MMFSIKIANFKLDFQLENFTCIEELKTRYKYFLCEEKKAGYPVILKACETSTEIVNMFYINYSNGFYRMDRNDIDVEIKETENGFVFHGRVEDYVYSFDMCVRGIINFLCAENGKLMLHSTGFVIDGVSNIFAGVESSGKSTLSKARPEENCILQSDEIMIVGYEKSKLTGFGTPFMGEIYSARPMEGYPLNKIHVLSGWGENSMEEFGQGKSLGQLLRNSINYGSKTEMNNKFFETAIEIVNLLNLIKIIFSKKGFWKYFYEQKDV